jgi:hypothetical protein
MNSTGPVTGASSTISTNDGEDGVDSSRSDDAQQRSPSAWLITRVAPCSSESDFVHWAWSVAGAARHARFWRCQPTRAHGRRVPGDEAEAQETGRHTLRESHHVKDA